jgi:hypothetical protein
MIMPPRLRRLMLTAHLLASLGWTGALAGFLALAAAGVLTDDVVVVRSAYVAMDLVTWFAIVPLALAALLTGLVQALASPWGLLRHYWVVFKLLIVCAATYMLIAKTGPIGAVAEAARAGFADGAMMEARLSILGHAIGGLAVLVWAAALGIYKPAALTGYGRRKAGAQPVPAADI